MLTLKRRAVTLHPSGTQLRYFRLYVSAHLKFTLIPNLASTASGARKVEKKFPVGQGGGSGTT